MLLRQRLRALNTVASSDAPDLNITERTAQMPPSLQSPPGGAHRARRRTPLGSAGAAVPTLQRVGRPPCTRAGWSPVCSGWSALTASRPHAARLAVPQRRCTGREARAVAPGANAPLSSVGPGAAKRILHRGRIHTWRPPPGPASFTRSAQCARRKHEAGGRPRSRPAAVVATQAVQTGPPRLRRRHLRLSTVRDDPRHDIVEVSPFGEDGRPLDDCAAGWMGSAQSRHQCANRVVVHGAAA
jgi:hypothetical protein